MLQYHNMFKFKWGFKVVHSSKMQTWFKNSWSEIFQGNGGEPGAWVVIKINLEYPLVNFKVSTVTMERSTICFGVNQLFLWPGSIANYQFTRGGIIRISKGDWPMEWILSVTQGSWLISPCVFAMPQTAAIDVPRQLNLDESTRVHV